MSPSASASRRMTRMARRYPTTETLPTQRSVQYTQHFASTNEHSDSRYQKKNRWEFISARKESTKTSVALSRPTRLQPSYNPPQG